MTRIVCVIPARMASSRFPGKPLKPLLGLALISHVYRRCRLYSGFERVAVATCDEEIRDAIAAEGGEILMTSDRHERCTDRVVEALDKMSLGLADDDFVLMVQGDEILVSPRMLLSVVETYQRHGSDVVNLISPLYTAADHDDPNTVKVVHDLRDRALYMSRAAIPSRARAGKDLKAYQQTGIIGFRAAFLPRFSLLEPTPMEKIESVDMMRVIEHGLSVHVVRTDIETIGVDTPADLARAEQVLARDPLLPSYHGKA